MFGRVKSRCKKVYTFLIRMKSLYNSYACNFTTLNQNVICDTISSIKYDTWMDKLRRNDIVLSDVGGTSENIDVMFLLARL